MKVPKYDMNFEGWDAGTVDLGLEQEAAYLRIIHQILRYRGPIPNSTQLLCQIWRCHPDKARELLSALVAAEKIAVRDGHLSSRKAASLLEGKKRKPREKKESGDRNPKWDEFVSAYPKRAGSNPDGTGRKKFEAKVAAGNKADDIIAGAKAYYQEQAELGKVGTEYIAQYTTFLNQERWRQYMTAAARHHSEDQRRWSRMLQTERERGTWPFEREPKSSIPTEFVQEWERDNPANVVALFKESA